jgi:spore maturation protein CgeB
MPTVFKSAKINLNPTLRANRTGIPLRVVDVLGSGGFLLTTHQAEMDDFFDSDEIIYYENAEEALDKVQYYLAHEEERIKIARSGYERIKKDFSFPDRIAKMFSTI